MAPCRDAMIKEVITVHPNDTVEKGINLFREKNIRSLPVVDDEGKLVGLFGLRHILIKLLPASATMEDGLTNLDFLMGAAPGIAKRLKKMKPILIKDVMEKEPIIVHQDGAMSEAVRMMAIHGSPLAIVQEDSHKFVGMISRQTLLEELEHMIEQIDAGVNLDDEDTDL